jgi:hypothetical protein
MPDAQIKPLTRTRTFWINAIGFGSVIGSVWSSMPSEQKTAVVSAAAMLWAALANWAKARERFVADGSPMADKIRDRTESDRLRDSTGGNAAPPVVQNSAATGDGP